MQRLCHWQDVRCISWYLMFILLPTRNTSLQSNLTVVNVVLCVTSQILIAGFYCWTLSLGGTMGLRDKLYLCRGARGNKVHQAQTNCLISKSRLRGGMPDCDGSQRQSQRGSLTHTTGWISCYLSDESTKLFGYYEVSTRDTDWDTFLGGCDFYL